MSAVTVALLLALAAEPAASAVPRRAEDPLGWYTGDVFYEVYVRSFADSDGDGHGDLRGLISKLDVLVDLGVDGLWLMPIYAGPTEHGYAVTDYDAVERRYGTMADARRLIGEAHARGLAVIFDFVPNHVSIEHPWFVAADGGDPLAQDHFRFVEARPEGWTVPWNHDDPGPVWSQSPKLGRWYYHAFHPTMPDLNLEDRPTRASMIGAARRWIERGVDGLRLDAVRYLYEEGPKLQADRVPSVRFLADLTEQLDRHGAMSVAEAWTNTKAAVRYLGKRRPGASMVFDFDRAYAIDRAIGEGKARDLEKAALQSDRLVRTWGGMATFVTNHDCVVPRPGNRGPDAAVLAQALVLFGGGVPFLWQGDELAMQAIDEPQIRRPMLWAPGPGAGFTTGEPWRALGGRRAADDLASQREDPRSPWRRTQAWLRVRRSSPALRYGVRHPISARGSSAVWAFVRHFGTDRVLVVANLADRSSKATLDLRAVRRLSRLTAMDGGDGLSAKKGRAAIALPPRSVRVFQIPRRGAGADVVIGRPGQDVDAIDAIDIGLAARADRSLGFSADVRRKMSCARSKRGGWKRCSVRMESSSSYELDELRWMARVSPGPYDVTVHLIGDAPKAPALSAEGEQMLKKGRVLHRRVMVRDGLLTLRPVPAGAPVDVTRIQIDPAKFRRIRPDVDVTADRVVVRAKKRGTVEWRIDGSDVEPVERTPLTKSGKRWTATLGPWPKGAVKEVSYIIRGPRGELFTGAQGQELRAAVP